MENLKEEFKNVCTWLKEISEEEADTYDQGGPEWDSVEHAFFVSNTVADFPIEEATIICINDDDFDEFTDEHGLTVWEDGKRENRDLAAAHQAVEKACDCKIVWNAQTEREEVTFNPDLELI